MNTIDLDELLVRSLQGRTTDAEESSLHQWRARSPDNEAYYRQFAAVWRMTAEEHRAQLGPAPPGREVLGDARTRWRLPAGAWGRAGLAAAAFAALSLGSFATQRALGPSGQHSHTTEITTGTDELTTITLWDGTAVRLGPNSDLHVSSPNGEDIVARLDGRAFFGVTPDSPHSFTVKTRHGEAVALGTRFEVHTEEEELKVLVIQGHVRVSSAMGAVDVQEGIMSRSAGDAPPSTWRVENILELMDWMGLALVFRETPLRQALSEIEHRYGVTVELNDPEVGEWPVTATFADQSVDGVVFVVCEIVGAECTVEDGRYRIGSLGSAERLPDAG